MCFDFEGMDRASLLWNYSWITGAKPAFSFETLNPVPGSPNSQFPNIQSPIFGFFSLLKSTWSFLFEIRLFLGKNVFSNSEKNPAKFMNLSRIPESATHRGCYKFYQQSFEFLSHSDIMLC